MAGKGPAPTGNAIRRNKGPEKTLLVSDGKLRGMDLPELPGDEQWHPMTVKWWEAWRRSPQAMRMLSEPDWYFLLDTALMHHTMWSKGRWEFAGEVRLRVQKFGATPEDRLRLRQEIEVPDTMAVGSGPGATVTSIASRRQRLT